MQVPLASGGGAREEGGETALGMGKGRPATTVLHEDEGRPEMARASAMDGRRCCGEADVEQADDVFPSRRSSGAWAGREVGRRGCGARAARNDHITLRRINSTKMAILIGIRKRQEAFSTMVKGLT